MPEGRHKQTPEHVPHVVPPTGKHVEPEAHGATSHVEDKRFHGHRSRGDLLSESSRPLPRSEATPGGSRETPKGPAGSRETRKRILDEIQHCAATDTLVSEELQAILEDLDDDGLANWAFLKWSFLKRAATDRYEAGRRLNMLLTTRAECGDA